ncbi:hypothetical protein BP1258A_5259 [Burkholderia pseudomallei 1258a]|nr:hypothetical protein BP1258A_5259 [Burkholderia pseudomallei 1258a]EIF59254.1 hypothetical protein BP1258B_4250 [Burkholderia pseudomallei 1258b]EIF60547.1 hypothetical protein BP1026A_2782 [Burkholderia pseudomallei 1026a]EIF77869.1 hypothetical protein BP354A_4367 [Burkholderia pseudomallei 354a]
MGMATYPDPTRSFNPFMLQSPLVPDSSRSRSCIAFMPNTTHENPPPLRRFFTARLSRTYSIRMKTKRARFHRQKAD